MDDLTLPSGVHYAVPFVPTIHTCKCGIKFRVDCEIVFGATAIQLFHHCSDDEGDYLIGPLLGAYEQREGKWVSVR